MKKKFVGTFKGEAVYFDGTAVWADGFDTYLDCDLNGTFRNWLAKRGIVLR